MKKMAMYVRCILILGAIAVYVVILQILPVDPPLVSIILMLIIVTFMLERVRVRLDALEKKIDNFGKQDTASCDCSGDATSNGNQQPENNSAAT